jgi:hypothetical protein
MLAGVRGRIGRAALVAVIGLLVWGLAAVPAGAVAPRARRASAPSAVTQSFTMPLTCTGDDWNDGGALNHAFSSLTVFAVGPTIVPFGGTYSLKLAFAVSVSTPAGSPWTSAGAGVGLSWPTHTIHAPNEVGFFDWVGAMTSITAATPATFTSATAMSDPIDVLGNVHDLIQTTIASVQVSVATPSNPPVQGQKVTMDCTPATPVFVAQAAIGPPPGGAPATDFVSISARDRTTGTILLEATGFVTSGNFVSSTDGSGNRVLFGRATVTDSTGGTATVTLLLSFKQFTGPGFFLVIPVLVLHVDDPAAGVSFDASSTSPITGANENYIGIAGGTASPSGDPVAVQWMVRDLAFR